MRIQEMIEKKKERGYTYAQIAELSGVPLGTVQKIFGGETAKTPVEGIGVASPAGAFRLKNSTVTRLGEDFLIESEVEYCVHGNH